MSKAERIFLPAKLKRTTPRESGNQSLCHLHMFCQVKDPSSYLRYSDIPFSLAKRIRRRANPAGQESPRLFCLLCTLTFHMKMLSMYLNRVLMSWACQKILSVSGSKIINITKKKNQTTSQTRIKQSAAAKCHKDQIRWAVPRRPTSFWSSPVAPSPSPAMRLTRGGIMVEPKRGSPASDKWIPTSFNHTAPAGQERQEQPQLLDCCCS